MAKPARTATGLLPGLLLACTLVATVLPATVMGQGRAIGIAHDLSVDYPPGSTYMGLKLLGTLSLESIRIGKGYVLHSLSALAYDEDADLLYALSDRGVLFHLRLGFENDLLTQAYAIDAYPLLDSGGRPLRGYAGDAEGMALRNARNGIARDTEVLVSFERRPRIIRYDVTGAATGVAVLPEALAAANAYRGGNLGLEAVAVHPQLGILTGAEQPMLNAPQDQVQVHAIERGFTWSYPRPAEANHALVALEALPDGRVLALERAHGFLYVPFITTVRELPPLPQRSARLGEGRIVARLSTGNGFVLDNFEGLTRHRGQHYLMVSDDNAKPFQATLLSYFQMLEPAQDSGRVPDTDSNSAH